MPSTLNLSREDMRALGYRVIDMLVEHFEELPEKPVTRKANRPTLETRLREAIPEHGSNALEVLDQLRQNVFSNIMHTDHPRFFAFVPSPSNFVSVMADALASGFNVFAGTWLEASGPTQIELVTIDWLRQACGLPDSAGGLFVSGGSMANMTALAVARHVKLGNRIEGAVVYFSDQTHSSIERGLRVLGFQDHQMRKIESDDCFRLDISALERAIEADRAAGRVPFCVVANAGTTNAGAIDPLLALADYCHQEELWLHVDGAYGAAAVFCERGQALLDGLGRVDSLSLDPHKWLFQPYEIACVLVREERWLKETFHILPEYLEDIEGKEGEVNFCDHGIQLTRGFRALKLWMSLQVFGRSGFQEAVNQGFEMAEVAETAVRELSNWEVVTPAQMGIMTFRCIPKDLSPEKVNWLNRELVEEMIADGFAMISSTVLRGQTVLRMCTINPRTTEADVRETINRLDDMSKGLLQ
ncbi:MAG: aminotransferase class V-fold PLP-dependent enzyme [Anaerolineales bacterium]|nr:MAG: aminotransferase class V-fold PLP-dependent enzyme [Anaerolineales bacterium]